MPDLPTIGGGPGETASTPASSTGISITAGGTNHVKNTTWTELIASTAYAANWLLVTLGTPSVVGASTGYLVDIGVGASTAEQVLVPNLRVMHPITTNPFPTSYLLPVRVASGQRISTRCQSSTASGTLVVTLSTISGGISAPPGCTNVEAIGAVTATTLGTQLDTGAVLNTDVVAQLTAATGFAYRWMCVSIANTTDIASGGATSYLLDIMTGAGGSEVLVVSDLWLRSDAVTDNPLPRSYCFPCSIASGARVAARARCSITTSGDRVLDLIAYGVG